MRNATDQITDHRGNNFVPNRDQAMLYRAGWRLTERRKLGCMWIVRWQDPSSGDTWPQSTAVEILKIQRRITSRPESSPCES